MNQKTIFVITALDCNLNNESLDSDRVFGYYFDLENAKKAVEDNKCDIHECLYNYVVIEEIPEGIHRHSKETWYAWSEGKYIACNKPKFLSYISAFGMG